MPTPALDQIRAATPTPDELSDAERTELAKRAVEACERRNREWTPAQWDEWRNRLANDLAQFTD